MSDGMSELLSFILTQEDFRKARLPSLYSDFTPLKTVNPDGYTANTTAWKSVLSKATYNGLIPSSSSSTDRLILPITPNLLSSLTIRDYGTPTALGCAVNDGIATEELIPLRTFLSREGSIYYKPWVDPWKVVSWGLRQVGVGGATSSVSGKLTNGEFVVVKNVEETSQKVVRDIGHGSRDIDRIMTLETLEHELPRILQGKDGFRLSEKDVKVLVKHLTRDLGEAKVQGKTIKFKAPESQLTPITDSDITTAQLKHLILTQNLKIEALSSKISALQAKAKKAAGENNKIIALSALKSKKLTEQHLQGVTDNLASLENVLVKIEQAVDNVTLVDTLEQGSKVLAKINKESGGIERVEKVLDELQEQMDETDEITRIVNEPGKIKMDEIEDDVQDEFAALFKEEAGRQKNSEEEERRKKEEAEKRRKEEEEAQLLADRLAGLNVADKPLVTADGEIAAHAVETIDTAVTQEIANMKEDDKRRDDQPEALPA
ncbi:Charged multivesicular body protein 7 [Orbilia ellipsospora]|uniref:Charged multivesicular body protein 7 n=1 Tax=Orbilia ellipsospora TaxID=2528407 RepID=A0AAV9XR02_9PEZI